jgi:hypothetical protein
VCSQNSATASNQRFQAAGFALVDQPSEDWSTADPAVGAENRDTSRHLRVFVHEAAKSISL